MATTCTNRTVLLLATGALLSGQIPPRFQAATRLVQVNVIVLDKNGLVGGLSKEDFVLQDEGKKQEIAEFKSYGQGKLSRHLAPNEFTNAHGDSAPEVVRYALGKAFTYGYANYTLGFYPQTSKKETSRFTN
jgi:hypothetical protein